MPIEVDTLDSKVIHTLRFPLICLVVCVHSFSFIKGWNVDALSLQNISGADIYSLFCISISMSLAHIAVPTFFVISGFLFFKGLERWNWDIYKGKMRKRIYTLLIPYLIWNTIFIIIKITPLVGGVFLNKLDGSVLSEWWYKNNGLLMYYHADTFVERISWFFGGEGLFSFPILVPMWYIRDLIVLLMLSPIIYWVARKRIYFLLILAVYITGIYPFIPGLSPSPLLFFSVGAYFSLKGYGLTVSIRKYRYSVYAVFFILWIILVPMAGYRTVQGNYFYPFFIISGVISILNIVSYFVEKEENEGNGYKLLSLFRDNESTCFFIFASHIILLPFFSKTIMKIGSIIANENIMPTIVFADQHPMLLIVCYLTKIAAVIVFCLCCSQVLQKYTPKIHRVLVGR